MSTNRIIQVLGEAIEIVVDSRSTRNTVCAVIQTSPPGGGPPPHMHSREDEIFLVLEGDYEFFDGERWTALAAGQCRAGLRNRPHGFRNAGSAVGRMFITVTPGGLDEYFGEISPLSLPADAGRLSEISRMYGIAFLPPETA